jgi:hypothetical protein
MALKVDGPRAAVIAMASRIAGNAISASFTRISPLSSLRKYPASAPISVPNTAFSATTETPMSMESCAPCNTRDHSERPKLSVPNSQSAEGSLNFIRIASFVGSTDVTHGASTAAAMMMPNSTSPDTNSLCRNSRRIVSRQGDCRTSGTSISSSSGADTASA